MSYAGDFESQEQEDYYHKQYLDQQAQSQEPDVVPCFQCGKPMYEKTSDPRMNYCDDCEKL